MDSSRLSQALPPFAAYGEDFAAHRIDEINARHERWLEVAHCLWRIGELPAAERQPVYAAAAETLGQGAQRRIGVERSLGDAVVERMRDDGAMVFAEAAQPASPSEDWSDRLINTVQAGADYLEKSGAFRLAYSLLSGLRSAVDEMPLRDLGRVIGQQGRIARRLGALQTAEDHYVIAERLGRRTNEPDLRVRATIGRGAVASMRGNYPRARAMFRQALRAAQASGLPAVEALAHKGLLAAAVAAKDADSALVHGWEAFRQAEGVAEEQAELAIALAEVALLAEHPRAALSACMHAVVLATRDHVRLAAYGTAALAAARLGRRELLDTLTTDARALAQRSQHLFDKAFTLLDLAEAYKCIGADTEARTLLSEALSLAKAGEFYQLLHRAEELSVALAAPREAPANRDTPIPLDRDNPLETGAMARLSPASRSVIRSLAALSN